MSTIKLYQDANYQGRKVELTAACPNLRNLDFKDKTTSVKVEGAAPWVLYQYENYGGNAWYVKEGNYPNHNAWHGSNDDVVSAQPLAELQCIEYLELRDEAAFNVKISSHYNIGEGIKRSGYHPTDPYPVGQTRMADLGKDLGVPEGAVVWLFVEVLAGDDHSAKKERFVYQKGCGTIASYAISGVTVDNSIHFNGLRQKGQ